MGKYLYIFTLAFVQSLKNVKALIGLSIFLITCLLIFANLWKIAAARMGTLPLSAEELLWYIAFNEWVIVSLPDVHEEMEEDLQTGRFAYLLPRPMSYLGATFFEGLGTFLANLLVLGVVTFTFTFTWWKVGTYPPALWISLLWGVLTGCLGLLFLLGIGLSAFWLGQVAPFYSVWEKLLLTLGGIMLPLSVYPDWLRQIAHWTPFPIILGDRSMLAIHFQEGEALSLGIRFALWTLFAVVALTFLYRQGLKKVNAEGGVRFFLSLIAVSIRASIGLRGAFILECFLMILNNLVFVALWWIFFRKFKEIEGWTMIDMIALNAVGLGAYGITRICFGGAIRLSQGILDGGLDLFMTQPKNLLLHLVGSKSFPKGWGHLMTTAILVVIGNLYTALPLLLIGMCTGAIVFASIGVIAHSLVFWLGSVEGVCKKYCESLYLFALYPTNIYSGLLQLVMFTLIPAGVITYLPVELLRSFSWIKLWTLILSAAGFAFLAFAIFYLGLRRYESGNRFKVKT